MSGESSRPRFANCVVADAKFATAPFLHTSDEVRLPILARLKKICRNSRRRWKTASVGSRQRTRCPMAKAASKSVMPMISIPGKLWMDCGPRPALLATQKSRNDHTGRLAHQSFHCQTAREFILCGMAHIQHHHSSSIRYLLRGSNPVLAAMQLKGMVWVSLRPAGADSS